MQRQSFEDSGAGGAYPTSRAPRTANLGFPSIGIQRELKWAIERYWRNETSADQMLETAGTLRAQHWKLQQQSALSFIPSNDFSLYDRMLDTSVMFDAIPERFRNLEKIGDLNRMFAMARGVPGVPALEMTKWFDTNYHYVVPELHEKQRFSLRVNPVLEAFEEAKSLGIQTRPVIVGPLTYLLLARYGGSDVLHLLPQLLDVYVELLGSLHEAGATWIQIDEPALALDLSGAERTAYTAAYECFAAEVPGISIMLTTYFGDLRENLTTACALPVGGIHLDCTRASGELEALAFGLASHQLLSVGVVDGRNIWRNDLHASQQMLRRAVEILGVDRVIIAPSCSLLHVPVDLCEETALSADLRSWMAFGTQKLGEIRALAASFIGEDEQTTRACSDARLVLDAHDVSPLIHRATVASRLTTIAPGDLSRIPYAERLSAQRQELSLPIFPTTTIGSLPQTAEVRSLRAAFRANGIDRATYDAEIRLRTKDAIDRQEQIGLDVLVHGEFERNDMVEFFGEQLLGCAVTQNGWVQSYGTRCVKPPVIYGDVERSGAMTVELTAYAQSLTDKPVKGMLTGPITILQWSFVRNDQPRSTTAMQLALALRDEVEDLEKAGINIIQIDEPALREGLPLRRDDHVAYLTWAVDAFRLAAGGASSTTQIHTHMCYAEFDHIVSAIAALDADVISLETARSSGTLFATLGTFRFPYMIGPGVYDIHSPNVPQCEEIIELIERAQRVIPIDQLWINPDCGLKTRNWEEVTPALTALVAAAHTLRERTLLTTT